ncbi:hypothetical protein HOY80DRAFT_1002222 [Tuber brumale]|nr:hypothetical protein HOY80DRAFT_1002222 [Tuber brumale]
MSFGRRLRKAVSKLICRRGSKPRTDTALAMIHPSQSFQSRPYETPVGVGASERVQPPPVARSGTQYATTGSPNRVQLEPSQAHRLSATGPDPEPENRNHGESSREEEQISEENRRQSNLWRSPTNISTSSSDYSNHSISHSLSPATPVPWLGRTLMGSHFVNTPPPTPPDSGSTDGSDTASGEGVKEHGHAPLIPQMSFIQQNSSAPDELRTEEVLSQLRITDDSRGIVYGQFTPQDSPITGQTPHDIPTHTTFETSYPKPTIHTMFHPQEIEQATDLLDREVRTSAAHTRIHPVVPQEHLPTKHRPETPTGEVAEPTDEETRQGDWGEVRRGESVANKDGSRELRTYDDDDNGAGRKATDDATGLLVGPKESGLTEVKGFTAGPGRAPIAPSQ